MPALTSNRQARAVSGVISWGWLKCVWIQIFPAERSSSTSSGSKIRCGSVTGTRVPMRITSRCSIAASSVTNQRSFDIGKRERIAPGDDDVVNFLMLANVVDHPLVVVAGTVPAVAIHGHALPRAEPAVHRANVRRHHQHPIGVAMGQARDRRVLVLFQRILRAPGPTGWSVPAAKGPIAAGSDRADRRR